MNPEELSTLITQATIDVFAEHNLDTALVDSAATVERPRNPENGDYSTNVALQLAKKAGVNPRQLATWLEEKLTQSPEISEVEVAGPGFINIRLASGAQAKVIQDILAAGADYGTGHNLEGEKINLEFVSANPTGPIHLGGTRWAAVGDALGRVLAAQGADVTREYYFNDHGTQLDRFSKSLYAAAKGAPTPEDGYGGEYIQDISQQVTAAHPEWADLDEDAARELFREHGVALMFPQIKQSLADFGTEFDVFFHEQDLYDKGDVDRAIQKLKDSGNLYESDGAWWLKSTDYGDDKDRVVIKSDGDMAYIAGDIAYVANKFDRGFTRAMYMLGADHHGYIGRLRAATEAMGYDPEQVEVLIGQMVNLVKGGTPVKMSKRAGTIITLDDLVDMIGVDAARYSLLRNSVDSSLDIDMDLWASQSSDNPVYYVQYGHARIASILRKAEMLGVPLPELTDGQLHGVDFSLLTTEKEGDLLRTLGEFPAVVATAAELREPHRVARYVESLAGAFHKFYDDSQILPKPDEEMNPVYAARLALAAATKQTIANALKLLGVSAPEQM